MAWKSLSPKSRYSSTLRSKKFEEILGNVEEEYPEYDSARQYKIAMGIFKKTKYFKRSKK